MVNGLGRYSRPNGVQVPKTYILPQKAYLDTLEHVSWLRWTLRVGVLEVNGACPLFV